MPAKDPSSEASAPAKEEGSAKADEAAKDEPAGQATEAAPEGGGADDAKAEATSPVAETEDGYHASTGRPDGVLVAAREHVFDEISDADYRVEEFTGINYMRIELDFTVG